MNIRGIIYGTLEFLIPIVIFFGLMDIMRTKKSPSRAKSFKVCSYTIAIVLVMALLTPYVERAKPYFEMIKYLVVGD